MQLLKMGVLVSPTLANEKIRFPRSSGEIGEGYLSGTILAVEEDGNEYFDLTSLSTDDLTNENGIQTNDASLCRRKIKNNDLGPCFAVEVVFQQHYRKNLILPLLFAYNPHLKNIPLPLLSFESKGVGRYETTEIKTDEQMNALRGAIAAAFTDAWLSTVLNHIDIDDIGNLSINDDNNNLNRENNNSGINDQHPQHYQQYQQYRQDQYEDIDIDIEIPNTSRPVTRSSITKQNNVIQSTSGPLNKASQKKKGLETGVRPVIRTRRVANAKKGGRQITRKGSMRHSTVIYKPLSPQSTNDLPKTRMLKTKPLTKKKALPSDRLKQRAIVCHAAMQGRRPTMEDEYFIGNLDNWEVYAIYDGHGGRLTAEELRDGLGPLILDTLIKSKANTRTSPAIIEKILKECFKQQENLLYNKWINTKQQQQRLQENKDNSKKTNKEYFEEAMSGSCAIVAVRCLDHIYICNVGDSRCILMIPGNNVLQNTSHMKQVEIKDNESTKSKKKTIQEENFIVYTTIDHKPEDERERIRIESTHGFVSFEDGAYRVNGILAAAHAFGDFGQVYSRSPTSKKNVLTGLKVDAQDRLLVNPPLSAEPDITHMKLTPGSCAILCCDGVFDVLASSDVVQFVRNDANNIHPTGQTICDRLVDLAFKAGSYDNISALIVRFEFEP